MAEHSRKRNRKYKGPKAGKFLTKTHIMSRGLWIIKLRLNGNGRRGQILKSIVDYSKAL